MRHAVLGAGGIGGLIAAALARIGHPVVLLLRDETLATYTGQMTVESVSLGDFVVDVPAVSTLDRDVDVLWVAIKATQLERALDLAPPERIGDATVIPLMNGVDHVTVLGERYRTVVAGAIRVESERVSPSQIRQPSPFLRVELAGADAAAEELRAAGIECRVCDDELSLLWGKLAFLAPVALATTALDAPLGDVRDDARYNACRAETIAIARAEGAIIDEAALSMLQGQAPADMRSSMQKDVERGRQPELDAIAGPIMRGSERHGIAAPGTAELVRRVEARIESVSATR